MGQVLYDSKLLKASCLSIVNYGHVDKNCCLVKDAIAAPAQNLVIR